MRCWNLQVSVQKFFTTVLWKWQKNYNVELVVRSSLNRSEGTVVKEGSNMEKFTGYRCGCR